jgi:mRNA-degrading endonuclease RelE of RelBE toxin-antitoxin system
VLPQVRDIRPKFLQDYRDPLPADTRLRVQRSLRVLEQFPRIGRQLEGRWAPMRVILGPWRWMLIIYSYEEPDDVVLIVAFQDARSSAAATAS